MKGRKIDTGEQLLDVLMNADTGPFTIRTGAVAEAVDTLSTMMTSTITGPLVDVVPMLDKVHALAEVIRDNLMCGDDRQAARQLQMVLLGTGYRSAMFYVALRLLDDRQFVAWCAAVDEDSATLGKLRNAARAREHARNKSEASARKATREALARASTGGKR